MTILEPPTVALLFKVFDGSQNARIPRAPSETPHKLKRSDRPMEVVVSIVASMTMVDDTVQANVKIILIT